MNTQARRRMSHTRREIFDRYEKAYTLADAGAALFFVTGSVLFFSEQTQTAGTWMFLLGSLLFLVRPGVTMLREYHIAHLPIPGDDDRKR